DVRQQFCLSLRRWPRQTPYCHYPLLTFVCKGPASAKKQTYTFNRFSMTSAAAIESRTAKVTARSTTSHIVSIDVFRNLSEVEPIWRALEDHLSTPYQRFDFLASWQRDVGERERLAPFIVIARDASRQP